MLRLQRVLGLEGGDDLIVVGDVVFGLDFDVAVEVDLKVVDFLGGLVVDDQGVGQRVLLKENTLVKSRGHEETSRVEHEGLVVGELEGLEVCLDLTWDGTSTEETLGVLGGRVTKGDERSVRSLGLDLERHVPVLSLAGRWDGPRHLELERQGVKTR